jgi:mannan polymerase II complex ANP1 subunit
MAKRMGFSVIGLPHYTIWHLYEPSVDDVRHAEELEEKRKARDREENERTIKARKIMAEFVNPNGQWEGDKAAMQVV